MIFKLTCMTFILGVMVASIGCTPSDDPAHERAKSPFEQVKIGMMEDEVFEILGKPDSLRLNQPIGPAEGATDLERKRYWAGACVHDLVYEGEATIGISAASKVIAIYLHP